MPNVILAVVDVPDVADALWPLRTISRNRPALSDVPLAAAHTLGSGMLVGGAFTCHPLRNLFPGGMTRYMLAHAGLPVLLRY